MKLTDEQIAAIRDGTEGVTPGPWQALRSDPAEGVNCHWIKAQPSPALRGFSKEIAYVGGTYYADGPDVRDAAHIARCDPDTIRAFATEVLEIRAEIAAKDARIAELERALDDFQSYGCPLCNGDCASANPPVSLCPMQCARAALGRDA